LLYGAAAVAALWFSSTIVGAINRLPLVRPACFAFPFFFVGAWRLVAFCRLR
jgi:hypothetical protein